VLHVLFHLDLFQRKKRGKKEKNGANGIDQARILRTNQRLKIVKNRVETEGVDVNEVDHDHIHRDLVREVEAKWAMVR